MSSHKCVLCRFYLFLKYRSIYVQKNKDFHQELYSIYTLVFLFFCGKLDHFFKSKSVCTNIKKEKKNEMNVSA